MHPLFIHIFTHAGLSWFYKNVAPQVTADNTKGKAWITTLACSIVTSVASIGPVLQAVVTARDAGQMLYGSSNDTSDFYAHFFLSYLAHDMYYMYYKIYPGGYSIQSWIHHIAYMGVLLLTLKYKITGLVLLTFPVEISTIPLSIGYIWPKQRRVVLTATLFFMVRIVYHAWVLWLLVKTRRQSPIPSPILPVFCFAAWSMHIYWFSRIIQYIYKQKQHRNQNNN